MPHDFELAIIDDRKDQQTSNFDLSLTRTQVDETAFSQQSEEFPPGTFINDKYRIEQKLAEGGVGQVYKATDVVVSRIVAVKFLDKRFSDDLSSKKRFLKEARATGSLQHPNIVAIYDIGEFNERLYIVMEFIDGLSLAELVRDFGPVPEQRAVELITQVCDALSIAHSTGIVHRDIKPTNVMLLRSGSTAQTVKLVDFGLAQLEETTDSKLTKSGFITGSPAYMSPEQCNGSKVDFRSDIYSLGCTLYELLTGMPPFDASSVAEVLIKHVTESPPTLEESGSLRGLKFSPGLEHVIKKMLSKDPNDRYQSADILSEALRETEELWEAIGDEEHDQPAPKLKRSLLIASCAIAITTIAVMCIAKFQIDKRTPSQSPSQTVSPSIAGSKPQQMVPVFENREPRIKPLSEEDWRDPKYVKINFPPDESVGQIFATLRRKAAPVPAKGLILLDRSSCNIVLELDCGETDLKKYSAHGVMEKLPDVFFGLRLSDAQDWDLESAKKLVALRELRLQRGTFTQSGLQEILQLKNVADLSLRGVKVDPNVLTTVASMHQLVRLELDHITLTKELLLAIGKLQGLEALILTNTNMHDAGLSELAKLTKLKSVNLTGNDGLTCEGLRSLSELKDLQSLYLGGIKLSNCSMQFAREIPRLNHLDLTNCSLSDKQLKELANMQITELSIEDNPHATTLGIACLFKSSHLSAINLKQCNVGPELLTELGKSSIRRIVLDENNWSKSDRLKLHKALPDSHISFTGASNSDAEVQ